MWPFSTIKNLKSEIGRVERRKLNNIYKRARMEHYEAGKTGRWENDWSVVTKTPYEDIAGGLSKIIARSRRAVSNSGFAANAVNVILDNVICDGIRPIPIVKKEDGTGNDAINDDLRAAWDIFADQFDRSGRSSFYECQRLALETIIISGSVLVNQVESAKDSYLPIAFQLREPDRLDFSKDTAFKTIEMNAGIKQTVHGINIDKYDVPASFWFQGIDNPISADYCNIAFKRHRPEQYIGVPWFAPVLKRLWDVQNLVEDQAIKSRIQTMIALWFESDADLPAIGEQDATDNNFNWFPGAVGRGPIGSKPSVIQADDTIKDSYLPMIQLLLRETAAALGLSYYSIARDIQDMNFAGSRSIIVDERRMFTGAIKWFSKEYSQVIYNKFVKWCATSGKVRGLTASMYAAKPYKYNSCFWTPRPWDWVDPVKDVNALIALKDAGWYSDDLYLASRGIDIDGFYEQLKWEKEQKELMGILKEVQDENKGKTEPVDPDNAQLEE